MRAMQYRPALPTVLPGICNMADLCTVWDAL